MKPDNVPDINRRDFLRGGSYTALMMLMGGVPVHGAESGQQSGGAVNPDGTTNYKGESVPVKVGVIGCGPWAREILKTLAILPNGPVAAICDVYPATLKRASDLAPGAQKYEDHRQLLQDVQVEAVVVATPSHLHKAIVLEALQAGKHVYCEAPVATTLEDAKAIALAARDSFKLNFQAGLQNRADKQILNLASFVRTGVLGRPLKARQQFHKKQSWRFPAPNEDRAKAINWRLDKRLSLGLVGEMGVHQIDVANWFFLARPVAVSGFGSLRQWRDGRDVFDNISVLFEYPGGLFLAFEATLGNSFDAEMGMFYGTDCAIMMRDRRAWMFKEADAPILGWEVYAKKDAFYGDSGIVLAAGFSKATSAPTAPAAASQTPEVVDERTPLQYALQAFLINSANHQAAVKDFSAAYDSKDTGPLKEYLASLDRTRLPCAGWREGYESAVTVIKANEAILGGGRLPYQEGWFDLA